jgi:hypothetical protein
MGTPVRGGDPPPGLPPRATALRSGMPSPRPQASRRRLGQGVLGLAQPLAGPGGTVTISVIAVPDGIRIEVIDDGAPTVPAASIRQNDPPCLAEHGRGLQLVDALSARWGHYTDQAGTVTWFELAGEPHN